MIHFLCCLLAMTKVNHTIILDFLLNLNLFMNPDKCQSNIAFIIYHFIPLFHLLFIKLLKDTVGIIATVCTYLAENNINILDISQTIVQGYFNMMMIVDISAIQKAFGDIQNELTKLGEEKIGVQIKTQKEAIFDAMHRL